MPRKEPVIVGQVIAVVGVLGMFYPPVREAVEAAGGETAFQASVLSFVSFITYIMRSKVNPVE